MIYKTDRKILKAAKEAQQTLDGYFVIDPEKLFVYHSKSYYIEQVNEAKEGNPIRKLRIDSRYYQEAINNLAAEGLIKKYTRDTYQVTYQGWHNQAVRREERFKLMLTHVAFPSVVALITTLITLLLSRLF